MSKQIKIKAVAMWAFLNKPNTYNPDKPKYQVDLTNLSDAAVKAIEGLDIEVQRNEKKPEKGFYIVAKSNYPIKAYLKSGEEFTGMLSNGSEVEVVLGSFTTGYKNKTWQAASIKSLVITKLIEFKPEETVVEDTEEAL